MVQYLTIGISLWCSQGSRSTPSVKITLLPFVLSDMRLTKTRIGIRVSQHLKHLSVPVMMTIGDY